MERKRKRKRERERERQRETEIHVKRDREGERQTERDTERERERVLTWIYYTQTQYASNLLSQLPSSNYPSDRAGEDRMNQNKQKC